MRTAYMRLTLLTAAVFVLLSSTCAFAFSPGNWELLLRARNEGSALGCFIGVRPWAQDGYDGPGGGIDLSNQWGIWTLIYRENGPDWTGPTGFYNGDFESPIPVGESKTWWDICLWSQNYTPDPPNTTEFRTYSDQGRRPYGCWAHLVLDQVPESANWTGPMEFWLNLGQENVFTLPLATVTDPLQGTRMHITVYTPEPSSLLALAAGLVPLAGLALRRRRK